MKLTAFTVAATMALTASALPFKFFKHQSNTHHIPLNLTAIDMVNLTATVLQITPEAANKLLHPLQVASDVHHPGDHKSSWTHPNEVLEAHRNYVNKTGDVKSNVSIGVEETRNSVLNALKALFQRHVVPSHKTMPLNHTSIEIANLTIILKNITADHRYLQPQKVDSLHRPGHGRPIPTVNLQTRPNHPIKVRNSNSNNHVAASHKTSLDKTLVSRSSLHERGSGRLKALTNPTDPIRFELDTNGLAIPEGFQSI